MNTHARTISLLCAGAFLSSLCSPAWASSEEDGCAEEGPCPQAAPAAAAASKKRAARGKDAPESVPTASVAGADDPTSFIGKFTRTQTRAILRTGNPTVEVVPGNSIVVTYPSKCLTVWNELYAEPHACGAADVAGKWFAPFATFTDTSVKLEVPASKLAEQFKLTRQSERVDVGLYDAFTETGDLAAARAWVANPGDWVSERKPGRDGVTLIGASADLTVQAPIGSLVCVNPKQMEGLAQRDEKGFAKDASDDVRYRDTSPFRPPPEPLADEQLLLWTGLLAGGAAATYGGVSYIGGKSWDDDTKNSAMMGWVLFVSLPAGLASAFALPMPLMMVRANRAEQAGKDWLSAAYEPEGLDVPALGGEMVCSSTSMREPSHVKLRSDAPAGVNFSPVRVWVPTYPETWVSVQQVREAEPVRVQADQLKELFGY